MYSAQLCKIVRKKNQHSKYARFQYHLHEFHIKFVLIFDVINIELFIKKKEHFFIVTSSIGVDIRTDNAVTNTNDGHNVVKLISFGHPN